MKSTAAMICALTLPYTPAQAANSEAYISAGPGRYGVVTITEEIKHKQLILYYMSNDKRQCYLTFKEPRPASDLSLDAPPYLSLTDYGCDGKIDRISINSPGKDIREVELTRDDAHEEMFKKADQKYERTIREHKLLEAVDEYFQNLESNISRELEE